MIYLFPIFLLKKTMKSLFLIFSLFAVTMGLQCTQQYECQPITNDYNFASCTNGTCLCRNDKGFVGNATVESKCSCAGSVFYYQGSPLCKKCEAPSYILWDNGYPYCINPQECENLNLALKVAKCSARQFNRALVHGTKIGRNL